MRAFLLLNIVIAEIFGLRKPGVEDFLVVARKRMKAGNSLILNDIPVAD